MAAFRVLKDVCNNFEIELQRLSGELFSAKIGESYEDVFTKKLRDISLFTSKSRLLRAKPVSLTPQISDETRDKESVMREYGETAAWKIVEQQFVKHLTQSHSVQALITTPNKDLNPELVEKKEKLIQAFNKYKDQEAILQQLDLDLKEKEDELTSVRERWHDAVAELREIKEENEGVEEEVDTTGPYYNKLSLLVDKLSLMRCLSGRLATARTRGYDWLRDPHGRLAALKRARAHRTLLSFVQHE